MRSYGKKNEEELELDVLESVHKLKEKRPSTSLYRNRKAFKPVGRLYLNLRFHMIDRLRSVDYEYSTSVKFERL